MIPPIEDFNDGPVADDRDEFGAPCSICGKDTDLGAACCQECGKFCCDSCAEDHFPLEYGEYTNICFGCAGSDDILGESLSDELSDEPVVSDEDDFGDSCAECGVRFTDEPVETARINGCESTLFLYVCHKCNRLFCGECAKKKMAQRYDGPWIYCTDCAAKWPLKEDLEDDLPVESDVDEFKRGYWWCDRCQAEKSPYQVAFDETCTFCGHPVIWSLDE